MNNIFTMPRIIMIMRFLYVFIVFISTYPLSGQELTEWCGADRIGAELFSTNPDLQNDILKKEDELRKFTQGYKSSNPARSNDSLLIVPVVFHVIHNYGNENISDEQILSGLSVLNRTFRKRHPDTATIEAIYKPLAADCEIEFRLARKDPKGRCTSGINRIVSPLTSVGDHSVKNFIQWDPAKYLNVYVVKQIPNLAGHCLMPSQAAAKPEWDGIVISHQYLGNIGTSNEQRSVVMAHEAGHYLNLYHIWGGNNVPGYYYLPVGQAVNCTIGDEVDDTPPTIGWSVCS
ncbi:MAG: M43 family zinc metalloprotease, partial [Chitinophagales bacterium]|nr:M43 family zinc metalloprotease [Chitinophagales bacterium]